MAVAYAMNQAYQMPTWGTYPTLSMPSFGNAPAMASMMNYNYPM